MDAITVKLPEEVKNEREFCVLSSDYNEYNSVIAIAKKQHTIPYEVCTNINQRVPRIYLYGNKKSTEVL